MKALRNDRTSPAPCSAWDFWKRAAIALPIAVIYDVMCWLAYRFERAAEIINTQTGCGFGGATSAVLKTIAGGFHKPNTVRTCGEPAAGEP